MHKTSLLGLGLSAAVRKLDWHFVLSGFGMPKQSVRYTGAAFRKPTGDGFPQACLASNISKAYV